MPLWFLVLGAFALLAPGTCSPSSLSARCNARSLSVTRPFLRPRASALMAMSTSDDKISAAKWFSTMDKDGDGTISVKEFMSGYDQLEDELSNQPPVASRSIALKAERLLTGLAKKVSVDQEKRTVRLSLRRLKGDLEELDYRAGENVKLTETEILLLTTMTFLSFSSPLFFSHKVVEVLIPSMAALAAALGLTFEYVGKVAVSGGKEVAANSVIAAAESEASLAAAERAKAVLPLCAGISASASAFALLAPALLEHLIPNAAVLVSAEYFLLCPCVAILAAAIAALAAEDTAALCDRAKSIGQRRFASRADVSATWMSVADRVTKEGLNDRARWLSFALSVLPAPLFATIMPGALGEKCVLAAATAAAQAAYHLAKAEFSLAIATDAVAIKTRIAAVTETYANQGARAGALLPFTSALAGLCVAGAAFIVEINPLLACSFPALASVFAAAASVAKARCEIDFEATNTAASELAFRASDGEKDSLFLRPLLSVRSLIQTVARSVWTESKLKFSRVLRQLSKILSPRTKKRPPPQLPPLAPA